LGLVFLGTSEFAAAVLRRLAASPGHRPVLVLTRPDRRRGRGRHLASPPVAEAARALGLCLAQPEDVNSPSTLALIEGEGGGGRQTIAVCAFGALIKEPLLSEHELLNVHPSLLPRWRGAAPIERAIMAGDAETGVSIMRLTAGLDSGPVCLSASEPIRRHDTYGSLAPRLAQIGGELLVRALSERPSCTAQPEVGVTYAEKIGPEDRLLDPSRPAVELERTVRALAPHIGARLLLADGTALGVEQAALADSELPGVAEGRTAGTAAEAASRPHAHEGRLLLACDPGVLELLVVKPAGGRAMDAASYLRGHGLPGRT
jgi:methionyl-tRNA formyltransferase